ncbi:hypothetical protein C8D88_10310 [Lentzea atacamensis]|uniref:Uncharacterized protein n=2 Tax=Lentzea TaxID=165301 RepID=A0A316I527_9PSEU|nr:hypothetical protein [Lentzea atacamensis]PWK87814.1 hypothetical protein C8D88_10310 [Lentzea atacamensis]
MVREDDLRATFSALHAEEAPPRAVTAADLIQRGQAVRTRRRTIAVVGTGLATVGVVAVALAVLPATTPSDPAVPGPSTTTAPPRPESPVPTTAPPSSSESTRTTTVLPPNSSRPPTPGPSTTPPGTTSTPGMPPVTQPNTSINPTSSSTSVLSVPPTTRSG